MSLGVRFKVFIVICIVQVVSPAKGLKMQVANLSPQPVKPSLEAPTTTININHQQQQVTKPLLSAATIKSLPNIKLENIDLLMEKNNMKFINSPKTLSNPFLTQNDERNQQEVSTNDFNVLNSIQEGTPNYKAPRLVKGYRQKIPFVNNVIRNQDSSNMPQIVDQDSYKVVQENPMRTKLVNNQENNYITNQNNIDVNVMQDFNGLSKPQSPYQNVDPRFENSKLNKPLVTQNNFANFPTLQTSNVSPTLTEKDVDQLVDTTKVYNPKVPNYFGASHSLVTNEKITPGAPMVSLKDISQEVNNVQILPTPYLNGNDIRLTNGNFMNQQNVNYNLENNAGNVEDNKNNYNEVFQSSQQNSVQANPFNIPNNINNNLNSNGDQQFTLPKVNTKNSAFNNVKYLPNINNKDKYLPLNSDVNFFSNLNNIQSIPNIINRNDIDERFISPYNILQDNALNNVKFLPNINLKDQPSAQANGIFNVDVNNNFNSIKTMPKIAAKDQLVSLLNDISSSINFDDSNKAQSPKFNNFNSYQALTNAIPQANVFNNGNTVQNSLPFISDIPLQGNAFNNMNNGNNLMLNLPNEFNNLQSIPLNMPFNPRNQLITPTFDVSSNGNAFDFNKLQLPNEQLVTNEASSQLNLKEFSSQGNAMNNLYNIQFKPNNNFKDQLHTSPNIFPPNILNDITYLPKTNVKDQIIPPLKEIPSNINKLNVGKTLLDAIILEKAIAPNDAVSKGKFFNNFNGVQSKFSVKDQFLTNAYDQIGPNHVLSPVNLFIGMNNLQPSSSELNSNDNDKLNSNIAKFSNFENQGFGNTANQLKPQLGKNINSKTTSSDNVNEFNNNIANDIINSVNVPKLQNNILPKVNNVPSSIVLSPSNSVIPAWDKLVPNMNNNPTLFNQPNANNDDTLTSFKTQPFSNINNVDFKSTTLFNGVSNAGNSLPVSKLATKDKMGFPAMPKKKYEFPNFSLLSQNSKSLGSIPPVAPLSVTKIPPLATINSMTIPNNPPKINVSSALEFAKKNIFGTFGDEKYKIQQKPLIIDQTISNPVFTPNLIKTNAVPTPNNNVLYPSLTMPDKSFNIVPQTTTNNNLLANNVLNTSPQFGTGYQNPITNTKTYYEVESNGQIDSLSISPAITSNIFGSSYQDPLTFAKSYLEVESLGSDNLVKSSPNNNNILNAIPSTYQNPFLNDQSNGPNPIVLNDELNSFNQFNNINNILNVPPSKINTNSYPKVELFNNYNNVLESSPFVSPASQNLAASTFTNNLPPNIPLVYPTSNINDFSYSRPNTLFSSGITSVSEINASQNPLPSARDFQPSTLSISLPNEVDTPFTIAPYFSNNFGTVSSYTTPFLNTFNPFVPNEMPIAQPSKLYEPSIPIFTENSMNSNRFAFSKESRPSQYNNDIKYISSNPYPAVSNLPNVYTSPAQNVQIFSNAMQPGISYTNISPMNVLMPQGNSLFPTNDIVNSINDVGKVVAKNALTSLIRKRFRPNPPSSPLPYSFYSNIYQENSPSSEPYFFNSNPSTIPSSNNSPFPSISSRFEEFEIPDFLSEMSVPNLFNDFVENQLDLNEFGNELNSFVPYMSALNINVLPIIEDLPGIPSQQLSHLYDFSSPSFLPSINIPNYVGPQIVEVPPVKSKKKYRDKDLQRLVGLLVLNELINNENNDIDSLETLLALLCVS